MRWLESLRQQKIKDGLNRASRHVVETLESRTLLDATLTSPINAVAIAAGSTSPTIDLSQHFNDPLVPGTLVEITTPEGTIPVALSDAKTPKTVANFLSYITNGQYQGTIIHRSVPGFVIQGGGYTPAGSPITQQAVVVSEAGTSNTVGTIAMALSTGPNSGTSQWFINLANNTSLDTSANNSGGPFTAFGNLVYGGQVVANKIAALQIVNDSQNPPGAAGGANIWVQLPVINYSGSTTPTSVPPANLVGTTYQVTPALTYTATTDDPTVATPAISGSSLSLAFGSGTGNTQVHVTATDIGGNTATSTFSVGVGLATVTIGTKGVQVLRYRDAGGSVAFISLSGGKGTATVTMVGANLVQLPGRNTVVTVQGQVSSASIAVTGTSPTSVLTIVGQGGNGIVHLTGLTNDARLALLNAPRVSIDGNLTETGAIDKTILGNASNGTITIGAGKVADLNITTMNNEAINSFIPIDDLNVDTWTGSASINATSLNNIKIKHSFGGSINATRVIKFQAGALVGGSWNITGGVRSLTTRSIANWTSNSVNIGNLRVQGAVTGSTIITSSDITSVRAGSFTSTNLYAGAANLTSGLPSAATEFTSADKIISLKVNRFVNSNVVAQRIDSLSLGAVQVDNSGTPFGVATQRIKNLSLSASKKSLHLSNVTTAAKVTSGLSARGITPQDLTIKIL